LCSATAHLHISNGNFFHQSANFSKKCCSTTANPRFRYDVEVLTKKCCGTAVVQRILAEFGSVGIQNYLLKRCRIRIRFWLKGTMSRDFSSPVFFFIKQLLLVPMGMPRNGFEFLRIFVELFVFVIDYPVMNTPGSRLESLK
jgi:hypothetical protein